jgi:energy-converting hydrogenase Eha subunit F
VAGLVAIPAGVALHGYVLPVMGRAAQTALPPSMLKAYHAPQLILLGLAGLVIAVAGALLPAGWRPRPAPRSRCAPSSPLAPPQRRAAQRTQVTAAGRAASRSSPMGCPHRSHTP